MKAHLLTSEFPIVSGQNQTADCGKEIVSAQTVFMWDEAAMGEGLSYGKNVCDKCQLADKGPRGRMIVYGIVQRMSIEEISGCIEDFTGGRTLKEFLEENDED